MSIVRYDRLGTVDLFVLPATYRPGRPVGDRRTQTMQLAIAPPITGDLDAYVDAIEEQLRLAAQAAGPIPFSDPVYFVVDRIGEPLRFPLVPGEDGSCGWLDWDGATQYIGQGWSAGPTLTLSTTAGTDGQRIVDAVSATLTNGASTVVRANVPGQLPARIRFTATDVSTGGAIIQRLIVGARTLNDMVGADFSPWVDAANAGGTTVADASAVGGSYERRALTDDWLPVARYEKPAGWANVGEFFPLVRIKDNAYDLRAPLNPTLRRATPTIAYVGNTAQMVRDSTYQDSNQDILEASFRGAVKQGNGILATAASASTSTTLTVPPGFTTAVTGTSSTGAARAWIVYKAVAGPGDTSTVWQVSGGGLDLNVMEIEGWATSPLDDAGSNSSGGDVTVLSGAVAQANELLVGLNVDVGESAVARGFKTPWGIFAALGWDFGAEFNVAGKTAFRWIRRIQGWGTRLGTGSADVTVAASFKGLSSEAGLLALDTVYDFCVAPIKGGIIGPVSEVVSYTVQPGFVTAEVSTALRAEWEAPDDGDTPDDYRYWVRANGDLWLYGDVGSATTGINILSLGNLTAGDPPGYTRTISEYRLRYGPASEVGMVTAGPFRSEQVGAWHMPSRPPGTLMLPPQMPREGHDAVDWVTILEQRNVSGQTANGEADAMALLPAESSVLVLEPFETVTDNLAWVYDQRWDGRATALLMDGSDEAGTLRPEGWLDVGPGDVEFTIVADVQGNASNTSTAQLTFKLELVTRNIFVGRRH